MASGYAPFDEYNTEFRNVVREMDQRLHLHQQQDQDDGVHIGDLLTQSQDLLLQMKVEARDAPGSSLKRELKDIMEAFEMQLQSYKTLHQQKELFASSSNNKGRMLATQDKVSHQNDQLESALRSIRETEDLAGEMGQELGRNRETLERAQGNVGKLSGMMEQADGHLKGMMRKWF